GRNLAPRKRPRRLRRSGPAGIARLLAGYVCLGYARGRSEAAGCQALSFATRDFCASSLPTHCPTRTRSLWSSTCARTPKRPTADDGRRVVELDAAELEAKSPLCSRYRREYTLVDADFGGIFQNAKAMRYEVVWCMVRGGR